MNQSDQGQAPFNWFQRSINTRDIALDRLIGLLAGIFLVLITFTFGILGVVLLQRERVASRGSSARWVSKLSDVPDGALVTQESNPGTALLHWRGVIHPWTPDGYLPAVAARPDEAASVITPQSVCRVLPAVSCLPVSWLGFTSQQDGPNLAPC